MAAISYAFALFCLPGVCHRREQSLAYVYLLSFSTIFSSPLGITPLRDLFCTLCTPRSNSLLPFLEFSSGVSLFAVANVGKNAIFLFKSIEQNIYI